MAAVNMTEGSITKHLVDYSIPLILGNMFMSAHPMAVIMLGLL